MLTRKGQSLIEVVVALSIIAIVFAGTITLIVQAVNLQLLARDKTEAVAIAQGEVSKAVEEIRAGCSQEEYSSSYEADAEEGERYSYRVKANIEDDEFDYREGDEDIGLNEENFLRITVRVEWQNKRGLEQEYETSRLVRRE